MSNDDPKSVQAGTLYVVGTPIGNLEDLTLRAARILRQVDLIAAEDTRHTGQLLQHLQATAPQVSYHEHNRRQRLPELLTALRQGKAIALVSDAGMPGISDPGQELVSACIAAEIPIVPVPGCNAGILALVGSGLPMDRFIFEGFLPAKTNQRRQQLETLVSDPRTLIFYEAPHRLRQTLTDLAGVFGDNRPLVLARELTKRYETWWRGTCGEAVVYYADREPRGEFTIVVAGSSAETGKRTAMSKADLKAELTELLQQGLSRSQASRQLAALTSLPRRELYQMTLELEVEP